MSYRDLADEDCSIARPIAVLGDRWTLIVLRQCFRGVRRFEEFQSTLGLSRSVLSQRLGHLVENGILERRAYTGDRRSRDEYVLTDKGMDLYPVLMALRTWSDKYQAPDGALVEYHHRGCSGSAVVRHMCAECGQELTARDVTPMPGPGAAVRRAASPSEPSAGSAAR
jgi:DNA-binding HxlR family transcriptional regulator